MIYTNDFNAKYSLFLFDSCYSQIRRVNHLATISLNLLLTLCASNLVFIVGVQTSKNIFKCEMIAVLLHYFHLSTAVWGLCHSFSIYDYVVNENVPVIKYNNLLAFGASAVFVLVSGFFSILKGLEFFNKTKSKLPSK